MLPSRAKAADNTNEWGISLRDLCFGTALNTPQHQPSPVADWELTIKPATFHRSHLLCWWQPGSSPGSAGAGRRQVRHSPASFQAELGTLGSLQVVAETAALLRAQVCLQEQAGCSAVHRQALNTKPRNGSVYYRSPSQQGQATKYPLCPSLVTSPFGPFSPFLLLSGFPSPAEPPSPQPKWRRGCS